VNKVHRVIATVVLAAGIAASAHAQTIQGTVVDDSTGRPIDGALVTLLDAHSTDVGRAPLRSDAAGHFVMQAGKRGSYRLSVVRIGYQPVTSAVYEVADAELVALTLRMTNVAQRVTTVLVTERRHLNLKELMSPMGFDLRHSRPTIGLILDTATIAKYGIHPLSEVFESYRGMSGLTVDLNQGHVDIGIVNGLTSCKPPELYFDGFLRKGMAAEILTTISADQVYGIEVYDRNAIPPPNLGGDFGTQPPPFSGGRVSLSDTKKCGVIAVWTKAFAARAGRAGGTPPPG
jgi:hypothetical protein